MLLLLMLPRPQPRPRPNLAVIKNRYDYAHGLRNDFLNGLPLAPAGDLVSSQSEQSLFCPLYIWLHLSFFP